MKDLLNKILVPSPEKRLSIGQIKESDWFLEGGYTEEDESQVRGTPSGIMAALQHRCCCSSCLWQTMTKRAHKISRTQKSWRWGTR